LARSFALASAFGLLLLVGCMGGSANQEHDPIVGGVPLSRMALPPGRGAGETSTAGVAPAANGVAPPVPSPSGPSSPAALASTGPQADGVYPVVRVGTPQPNETQGRITPVAVASSSAPVASSTSAPGGEYSYEQLQTLLAARGVAMQKLETVGDRGEWKFSCAIPNRQMPNLRRNYEAQAIGPYGLAAMRAVLDRIDLEQGNRR
jgi:hypothetical protein